MARLTVGCVMWRGIVVGWSVAAGLLISNIGASLAQPVDQSAICNLTGRWKSSIGDLTIGQADPIVGGAGTPVSAIYHSATGAARIDGVLVDRRLTVRWSEPPDFTAPAHGGTGYFQIAAGCNRMQGEFRNGDNGPSREWSAERLDGTPAAPASEQAAALDLARRLDTAAATLRAADARFPREEFDVRALASQLGPNPDNALNWVTVHTMLVPYRGVLRGALGVLFDRRGNSLDRSLLLAELLGAGGHDVRLARGVLDQSAVRTVASSSHGLGDATPEPALERGPLADATIDPALAEPAAALAQAINDGFADSVGRLVGDQTNALLALVGQFRSGNPTPEIDVQALADHWWVQLRDGENWRDLDPMGFGGTAAVQASAFIAPTAVPDQLFHAVEVAVAVEIRDGGATHEAVLLKRRLRAAELVGVPITLRHLPMTRQTAAPADSAAVLASLQKETQWAPVLTIGASAFADRSFNDRGETPAADLAQTAAPLPLGGGFGAFGRALDQLGSPQVDPNGPLVVTAEWIDLAVEAPGQTPSHHRREVFDLTSRADPAAAAPAGSPQLRLKRALALINDFDVMVLAADPAPAFAASQVARNYAQVAEFLAEQLHSIAEGKGAAAPSDLPRLPLALEAFASQRRIGDAGRAALHLARPNVLIQRQGLRLDRNDSALAFTEIDIVENALAVDPGTQADAFATRLRQGVADTAIEGALLPGDTQVQNTAIRFARDRAAGATWIAIGPGDPAAAGQLELSAAAKSKIANDVRAGYIVVAPARMTGSGAETSVNWWRIDPRTGATLGVGENGAGQGLVEYRIAQVDLGLRLAGAGICIVKIARETKVYKQIAGAICLGASLVGVFGQGMKVVNLAWKITAMSKNAIDATKAAATGISLASGVITVF